MACQVGNFRRQHAARKSAYSWWPDGTLQTAAFEDSNQVTRYAAHAGANVLRQPTYFKAGEADARNDSSATPARKYILNASPDGLAASGALESVYKNIASAALLDGSGNCVRVAHGAGDCTRNDSAQACGIFHIVTDHIGAPCARLAPGGLHHRRARW